MFVRKVKRKTTRNIAVQIVRNDRTKEGKVRQKIVRHMGTAPEGPALDELLRVAERERLRIEEDRQPSLFPAEQSASVILVRQANWRNIAGGSPANESPNQAHFPRAVHGCSRGQT